MSTNIDLLRAKVVFRDRPLVDVLDLALRFVIAHARSYALASLVLVPAFALTVVAGMRGPWSGWVVGVVLAKACELPFTILASRLVFEPDVRVSDVLRTALRAMARVSMARLLTVPFFAVGLLFFLLPGVWVATTAFFLSEVMVLEHASLGQAIGRSQRLSAGSVGDALLGLLLLLALPFVGIALFDVGGRLALGELFQFRPPPSLFGEGFSVLGALGLFLGVPYFATARFFIYLNVRTRAEGWDIQTRFGVIAARLETDAAGVEGQGRAA